MTATPRSKDLLSPGAMGGFLAQLIAEADLGAPDVGTTAVAWGSEADG
jgi:hypothetical protein